MPFKGYIQTAEHKKKLGLVRRGKIFSEQHRKRISLALMGNQRTLGLKHSEKTLEKMRGRKAWNYIEDRTKLKRHNRRNDMFYKEWRSSVWRRDNYKCKIDNLDCNGRIEAHHVLSWRDYPELHYEINNGITLCHHHHPRKRCDEVKLSPYFKELVAEMK